MFVQPEKPPVCVLAEWRFIQPHFDFVISNDID
ncbi:protein of unknown function [Cupriavidus taiwanensis]|nr:protein of unknown function [Cupriavidus taiwanensis]